MAAGVWEQLVGNLAFVVLAIAMFAHLSIWYRRFIAGYEKLFFGTVAGCTSAGAILLAIQFHPGIYLDLRFAPLALAAAFGGPVSAAAAVIPAAIFRLYIGGAAALDGVVAILVVSTTGAAIYLLPRTRFSAGRILLFLTVALAVVLTALLAILPSLTKVGALSAIGLPLIATNCAATVICGLIMLKTDRVQLERRVLETAFSQSPDYLYVKDRDSKFITVNDNMARLFRFHAASDMTGLSDFNLRRLPEAEELYFREQDIMRTGEPLIDFLERMGERHLLASKVPLRDSEGQIIGLAGVTRDITERVELERELREKRNLLTLAMNGMSEGFAMFDKKGFLVFCNEQYRDAFPLSRDARVVGAHISDILRRVAETGERVGLPEEASDHWIEAAAATLPNNKDEEIQLKNGEWRALKTRLAQGGTAMVVVSDITVTKQAEIALKRSADQLRALADTDGLTGLTNRRAFDRVFASEIESCLKRDMPLSVLMIDVDRFKAYNDTYGHVAGDDCLRAVGKCLAKSIKRSTDLVARYGGEEFVVLLPNTDEKGAAVVAKEVIRFLAQENIPHSASEFGRVTASIGITSARGKGLQAGPERFLSAADAALYEAKQHGRNRAIARTFPNELAAVVPSLEPHCQVGAESAETLIPSAPMMSHRS